MKLYFAPLEGITTYTFRNTHAEMFGGVDAYFAPFINPSDLEKVSRKGMRDILPENDTTEKLKVQVLTSNAESFLKFCEKIKSLGYYEININIGCPAGTVVRKGRGSGFLQYPDAMDEFFHKIFSESDMKISVKTRVGYSVHDEFARLMEIYNRYPVSELTVHPRTREELYNGSASLESFAFAYNISKNPLCYNGDICMVKDYEKISEQFPDVSGVMLGRGAVMNPALFREIRGGERLSTEELVEFSERLSEKYRKVLGSDVFTLHKLKEIWIYAGRNFPEEKKLIKAIRKANTLEDFKSAIRALPKL
ncbi:MAG: tRNA-dihydrouridine synthase family protein [Oscillospiraceae bacterium]|nr:tRNA-dihydrouridine synthase family protein [Oscillospiraceae bacterium]